MPRKQLPTKDLLAVFAGMPTDVTLLELKDWLYGGKDHYRTQTNNLLDFALNKAKRLHVIVNMGKDKKRWSPSPVYFDEDGTVKGSNPKLTGKRKKRQEECHETFCSMPPSTFIEVLTWVTGVEPGDDGKVPTEAYKAGTREWDYARKTGILVKNSEGLWSYCG